MNPSEKRRQQLLERTRNLYSDRYRPPAVHPRYGKLYNQLYEPDREDEIAGTLGLRVVLALFIFAAFVTMDQSSGEVMGVSCDRIVQEIEADLDVEEVWREL